jgi:hypothetical protein
VPHATSGFVSGPIRHTVPSRGTLIGRVVLPRRCTYSFLTSSPLKHLPRFRNSKNVYALEERNNLFSKDPHIRKFDAERVLCDLCDKWLSVPPDDHQQASEKWLQHRESCKQASTSPIISYVYHSSNMRCYYNHCLAVAQQLPHPRSKLQPQPHSLQAHHQSTAPPPPQPQVLYHPNPPPLPPNPHLHIHSPPSHPNIAPSPTAHKTPRHFTTSHRQITPLPTSPVDGTRNKEQPPFVLITSSVRSNPIAYFALSAKNGSNFVRTVRIARIPGYNTGENVSRGSELLYPPSI